MKADCVNSELVSIQCGRNSWTLLYAKMSLVYIDRLSSYDQPVNCCFSSFRKGRAVILQCMVIGALHGSEFSPLTSVVGKQRIADFSSMQIVLDFSVWMFVTDFRICRMRVSGRSFCWRMFRNCSWPNKWYMYIASDIFLKKVSGRLLSVLRGHSFFFIPATTANDLWLRRIF